MSAYFSAEEQCWYVPVAPGMWQQADTTPPIEPARLELRDGQLWITLLDMAGMQGALELIAKPGCENYTGDTRCWQAGRTRGAQYGAEAWCPACIAQDALNRARAAA